MPTWIEVAADRWVPVRTRSYFTLMLLVALVELLYVV
jgi:hypothetical protein